MNDQNLLRARITRLFTDVLQREAPAPETDVFDAGLVDSLAFVDLLAALEREFGIGIALEDLEVDNFRSVTRMAAFVASRVATPTAAPNAQFSRPQPAVD